MAKDDTAGTLTKAGTRPHSQLCLWPPPASGEVDCGTWLALEGRPGLERPVPRTRCSWVINLIPAERAVRMEPILGWMVHLILCGVVARFPKNVFTTILLANLRLQL